MLTNRALVFKAVPDGWPVAGTHLVVDASCRFDPDQAPPPGGLTIRNHYVSFDPYQRGRLRAPGTKSYFPPYDLGQPISNSAIATVLKSDHPTFHPGDVLLGVFPTEEYSVVNAERAKTVRKLDNPHGLDPRLFLGPLSMPGLTAYSSLYEIGKPTSGETLFVSAASGAVGQVVGQLAKHQGLRVIGSVGDDAKLDFITTELGFDGGFNYKKEKPLEALRRLAPNGIDIYYENVGGEQLEAALEMMNDHGRIGELSPSPTDPARWAVTVDADLGPSQWRRVWSRNTISSRTSATVSRT